jgi:endonuclease/exonuclease/phosphatase family metal-dependent hydrolase
MRPSQRARATIGRLVSQAARAPECRRFAGRHAATGAPARFDGALDVVTLNIRFARQIARARQLFERSAELARATLVLLQEMDAEGTDALAAALGMDYVYYPATVHPRTGRDFGNAVLSRWPIASDRKVDLPHLSLRDRSARAATCASVLTPLGSVEVCSVHIATPFELPPGARRAQVRATLDALGGAARIVLGGDFNSYRLGGLAAGRAFDWPTRSIGATLGFFSVDHILVQGLRASRVGKLADTRGATDHAAVWARLVGA